MVTTGQTEIRQVPFVSSRHQNIPVEVAELEDLFERFGREYFRRPDRPAFSMLMFCHRGSARYRLDFEDVDLAPAQLLRVDPQQVLSWDVDADVGVTLILSNVDSSAGQQWQAPHAVGHPLDRESLAIANSLVDALRTEQARFRGEDASVAMMVHLFEALRALHDRAASQGPKASMPAAYVDYRNAIERSLGSTHHAGDLIADLGYSDRTVSRACQQVAGLTAKGVLTERLVLEAKRLLAHTDRPASAIGVELGFGEATNFHKFMVRHAGMSPAEVRRSIR